MKIALTILLAFTINSGKTFAQKMKDGQINFTEDGSRYILFNASAQCWFYWIQNNPYSTYNGKELNHSFNVGLRRIRAQAFVQASNKVSLFVQVGQNNIGPNTARRQGMALIDLAGQYDVVKEKLCLGIGLNGWGGPSRYASPSAANILGVDAPLYQQWTNDVSDMYIRKFGIYAKGGLDRFDYRIAMQQPMNILTGVQGNTPIGMSSSFSDAWPSWQLNSYFQYNFFDKESNMHPYKPGTYWGSKKILNLGAGMVYQPNAMWNLDKANLSDTLYHHLQVYAVDAFMELPLKNKQAINVYANITHSDLGPNYLREMGAFNSSNGVSQATTLNGSGNNTPAYGSGNTIYVQGAYKFIVGNRKIPIMPYASVQYSKYYALKDDFVFYEAGFALKPDSKFSKLTLGYQNRPVFAKDGALSTRKSECILQYQLQL